MAVFGTVADLDFNGGWQYRIKASYDGRNTSWVPEPRIRPISMSIFDNALMQTRAGFQGRFVDERERAVKWKRRFSEVRAGVPILEGEISRLKKAKTTLEAKAASLETSNHSLALELRESMPSAIFSRAKPEGRNATLIRAQVADMLTPQRRQHSSHLRANESCIPPFRRSS